MGAITTKLNAEWAEKQTDEKMFEIRAIIEEFYNNLADAISRGQSLYPTGDSTFDSYVLPIVNEMVTFKNGLESNYSEFIQWRQPV